MRVLILTAFLACANCAPSTLLASPAIVVPSAIPTISPGDLQAAAINAKVFADDQAQAAVDQARYLSEQAIEDQKEKVTETDDLAKEKNEEVFWSVEEKKWQALDAVKTAEAKLDGAVASNADTIAKSSFGVVVPYVAPVPQAIAPVPQLYSSPIVAPFAPYLPSSILYATPGLIAKTPELVKEADKSAAFVKNLEENKVDEKKETEVKSAEPEKAEEEKEKKAEFPVYTPLAVAPVAGIKLAQPWLAAPVAYSYVPQTYSTVQHVATPLLTPTILKTHW